MQNVKIADVAREAGVSIATVSRVLSGKQNVSQKARERVLEAVNRLGYRPNRIARSLRAKSSKTIGLIISDIQNPFFTAIVRAVEDVAQLHGYSVLLCNADEDPDKEALYIDLLMEERVAGVILSPTSSSSAPYHTLMQAGIPLVLFDRRLDDLRLDTVVVDGRSASKQIVSHLIEMGHTRIGAIFGTADASTGRERRAGYMDAFEENGLSFTPELVRTGVPKARTGYEQTTSLLALPKPPTALFTGNNLLTIGALRAIYEHHLAIPQDIAFAAFDEMDWMFLMNPPLTVVKQPIYEMGEQAANLILERIKQYDRPAVLVELQPTVYIRQSSTRILSPTS